MNERLPTPSGFGDLYERIKAILSDAHARAYRAINTAMVTAYWGIGRVIVEDEQQGQQRAEYGKGLLAELSKRLTAEFGRGFDRTNLQQMRAFYLAYPICDALRRELTWTHYRLLLRVENPDARAFYETEAVNSRYKLYLPTEKELAAELQRERQAIEMEARLREEPDSRSGQN